MTNDPNARSDSSYFRERLLKSVRESGRALRCFIRNFGCQQNVSDSQRIAGMMCECGYEMTEQAADADLIVFNTCAVREHAQDRVFGNVGELKRLKEANPELIIAIGGCMVQQQTVAKKLREHYPYVDIIFNTNELQKLPQYVFENMTERRRILAIECSDYSVCEGLPVRRDGESRAYVPVMYGCDNFCTYCVVPLVRGRERSRKAQDIVQEFESAVNAGYKDIMLLGQNVNSYGKNLEQDISFAQLLRMLDEIPGDFTIRFMTSHPKDATRELFDTIAQSKKISRQIHLPVQSGSNEILHRMNRKYTREQYLELIEYAKSHIEGVSFTSDIIVGFPGETREDFEQTLSLVKAVGYRSLFTFIYSPREGTAAAKLPDETPHEQKAQWLNELIAFQEGVSAKIENEMIGKSCKGLIVSEIADGQYEARLDDNSAVSVSGECELNSMHDILITDRVKKRLYGKVNDQ